VQNSSFSYGLKVRQYDLRSTVAVTEILLFCYMAGKRECFHVPSAHACIVAGAIELQAFPSTAAHSDM
jgi:hypothetical protein